MEGHIFCWARSDDDMAYLLRLAANNACTASVALYGCCLSACVLHLRLYAAHRASLPYYLRLPSHGARCCAAFHLLSTSPKTCNLALYIFPRVLPLFRDPANIPQLPAILAFHLSLFAGHGG